MSKGFETTQSAFTALRVSRLIASAHPLTIASEIVSDRLRIAVANSQPLMSGIPISVNTASKSPSCPS